MGFDTYDDLKRRMSITRVGKPALIGLVIILVMVAVLAAGRLSSAATAKDFEVVSSADAASAQAEDTTSSSSQSLVYVHVSGAVANPGIYGVAKGSRVADAVDAAGGFSDDAVTDSVNLARTINDGEQIIVAQQAPDGGADGNAAGMTASAGQSTVGYSHSGLVNINRASSAELQTLPGIGAATAEKIIADRESNGPYKTIDDLKRVSGIGDKKFEDLAALICI